MQYDAKNVTARDARKTALIVAGVLIALTVFFWFRGRHTLAAVLGVAGALLSLIGLFVPPLTIVFHHGWMRFAFALGYVNSRILLTLVYFLIFVPYGLISKLAGRDPLDLRSKRTSYWHKREVTRQPKARFERLF